MSEREDKKKWTKLITGPAGMRILLILGFLGMFLLLASSFFPQGQTEEANTNTERQEEDLWEEYASQTEEKIRRILSSVTAEDDLQVLVTLSGTSADIYATEESADTQTSQGGSGTVEERSQTRSEYVILRSSNGSEQALKLKTLSPEICGVVVVSRFADDPVLREAMVRVVTTSLQISSTRVCVVARGDEE